MKKKRIAALLLTAFLIVNEAVYPVDQYVTYAQSEPEEELNLEEGETEETVFSDQKNNEENSQEIGIEPEREEQDEKPGEGLLFSDGENTEGTQETGEGLSAEDGTILSENTDFVFDDKGVLTEYKGAGGTVVIPPDVTEIGDDVFKNNQTITAVEFPEGLKKIGSNAFSGCSGLEGELQLPDSLETIGINAFYNCNNITGKLIIPDKISQIPYGAFSGMKNVTGVVVGERVTEICTNYNSSHAFSGMDKVESVQFLGTVPPSIKDPYNNRYSVFDFMPNLKTIYIPQGTYQVYNSQYGDGIKAGAILKEEGSGDFVITDGELISYSGTDTEVTVPDQVTRIGAGAFRNNTTIQKVTLPAGVTAIGANGFNNCTALTEVDYTDSSSLTEIGESAFSGCTSLEQTVLGENMTKLGAKAFYNCKKLNLSMTLPKKLTVIEPSVFQGCMGLSGNLVIPEGVTTIGENAFYGCSGLTGDLDIPEKVTIIGEYAFNGCSGLEGELRLPDNLEIIGANAFYNCNNFTGKLIIPDKISQIPYGAFSGMKNVTGVVVGERVTEICTNYNSSHAFSGMDKVESVQFLGTVPPSIKDPYNNRYSVFDFMPNLKTIYIPQGTYQVYNSQYGDGIKAGVRLKEEGSGDFVITDGELISYSGTDTEVAVPDQVTRIGTGAFRNNTTVQKVTLPAGVTAIGAYGFNNCTALTEVDYTDSSNLTEIGESAFSGCTSLEQTVLGENVTKLGAKAFYNCRKLNLSMTLPKKLTVIEPSVFQGCMGLSGNLVIPEGVTTIRENAFNGCSGLTGNLDIPEKVTTIGNDAFNGCSGFGGTLTLPDSLKSIDRYAFYGCSEIAGELVIPGKITEIPYGTFSGMQKVTSVVLGEKVETIWTGYDSEHAFYQWNNVETVRFLSAVPPTVNSRYSTKYSVFYSMPNLKTVYIPQGTYQVYNSQYGDGIKAGVRLKEEGSGDFVITDGELISYSGTDTEVTVPDQVTRIGAGAFRNNTTIQKVTLPAGVTAIGANGFNNCTALTEVDYTDSSSLTEIGESAFSGCTSLEQTVLGENMTKLGAKAFYNCKKLNLSMTLPKKLTVIEPSVFQGCMGLSGNLVIPEGVTTIGENAFYGCSGLTGNLDIPEKVTTIGDNAFNGCSGLEGELRLPDNLEIIGANAFYNCNNFTGKLIIPDKISQIPYGAFSGMKNVTGVIVGERVTEICTNYNSSHAFSGMDKVESVQFLGTVPPSIKDPYNNRYSVFDFMPNLKTIYIPQGTYQVYNSQYGDGIKAGVRLKEEGSGDFVITDGELISYSGTDTEVAVPDQVTRIGTGAFRNNTTIQKVTLPAGVTAIGAYGFNNCTALTEVDYTDSSSLTEIGESAFSGCTSLEQTVLGENVTKLGTKAFYSCKKLNLSMTLPKKLTVIESSVFQGCMGLSGNLVIPEGVTTIRDNAFNGCSGLEGELRLPDNLEIIGANAFYNCNNFTGKLIIPDKISQIPYGAFSGMKNVTGVVVGERVTEICTNYNSSHAFSGMDKVESVQFLGTVPPSIKDPYNNRYSVFYFMPNLKKIYVLPDSLERYKETYGSGVKNSVEWSTDTSELPPSGLLAECIYSHSVYLTWKPADSDIVEGYQVYRDGTEKENLLTETPVKDTFYRDEGLETEETHIYYVCTSLTNGKRSSFAQVTATTKAPSVRKIYTDGSRYRVGIGKNKLYAEVADSANLKISGIKETRGEFYYLNQNGRKVYISEGKLTVGKAKGTAIYETSWNFDDLESGSYEVVFVLTDGDGESAEQKAEVQIDKSRPEQIQKVTATGDVDQVIISWRIAAELSTTGYRIYRKAETDEDYRVIGYINERNTVAYTDKSVKLDRTYQYYVTGVNEFKVESLPSEIVSASPSADTEKPQIIKMYPSAKSRINGRVSLGARAVDNIGIREIRLWVSTDKTNWSEAGIGDSDFVSASYNTEKIIFGNLWLRAIAVDTAGNESEPVICEYLVDNEGPSAVKILEEKCTVTSVTATLVWENVSEEDVGYFRVEQLTDGKWITVGDVRTTLGINLYGLLPETKYTYRVIAYDQLGNRGAEPEKPFMFYTKADDTPPVITALSPESASFSSEISVSAEAEDNCGIRKIILQVSENNQDWNNITEKEFTDGNKKERAEAVLSVKEFEEEIIYFRAVAEDINGHVSETDSKASFCSVLYRPYFAGSACTGKYRK